LQEWDWEMENGHGGATHIFVMASLHVKWLMFLPTWLGLGILWYFADACFAF
jgi:hypothetical protein